MLAGAKQACVQLISPPYRPTTTSRPLTTIYSPCVCRRVIGGQQQQSGIFIRQQQFFTVTRQHNNMGAFLSKPVTDVQTEFRRGNGLQMFAGAVQGWRVGMEDAHAFRMQLVDNIDSPLNKWSAFCLFDGHAGAGAATYCAENLLSDLLQHASMQSISRNASTTNNNNNNSDSAKSSTQSGTIGLHNISILSANSNIDALVEAALKDTFMQIDSKYRNSLDRIVSADHSGTTAMCCLISPQCVYVANCGDSRAIMAAAGSTAPPPTGGGHRPSAAAAAAAAQVPTTSQVVLATRDHKPDNPEERERIEKAGGSVVMGRVQGSLAVSRAIGDFDYKNNVDLPPSEQLVSCVPEIYTRRRDRANDQFLLIACDGLWDVFQNQEVADFVRHLLLTTRPGADQSQRLMERLLKTAINKDSRDNVTALIVGLDAMPAYDSECEAYDVVCDNFLQHKIVDFIDRNGAKMPHMSYRDVLSWIAQLEYVPNLPPGGGLVSKYDFIEQEFDRLKPPVPANVAMMNNTTTTSNTRLRSPSPSNSKPSGLAVPFNRDAVVVTRNNAPQQQQQAAAAKTTPSPGARKSNNTAGHPDLVTARDSERISVSSNSSSMQPARAAGGAAPPIAMSTARTREITIVVEPARVSGESQRNSSDATTPATRRVTHTYSINGGQQQQDGALTAAPQVSNNSAARASERSQGNAQSASARPSNSNNSEQQQQQQQQAAKSRASGSSNSGPPDNNVSYGNTRR